MINIYLVKQATFCSDCYCMVYVLRLVCDISPYGCLAYNLLSKVGGNCFYAINIVWCLISPQSVCVWAGANRPACYYCNASLLVCSTNLLAKIAQACVNLVAASYSCILVPKMVLTLCNLCCWSFPFINVSKCPICIITLIVTITQCNPYCNGVFLRALNINHT